MMKHNGGVYGDKWKNHWHFIQRYVNKSRRLSYFKHGSPTRVMRLDGGSL